MWTLRCCPVLPSLSLLCRDRRLPSPGSHGLTFLTPSPFSITLIVAARPSQLGPAPPPPPSPLCFNHRITCNFPHVSHTFKTLLQTVFSRKTVRAQEAELGALTCFHDHCLLLCLPNQSVSPWAPPVSHSLLDLQAPANVWHQGISSINVLSAWIDEFMKPAIRSLDPEEH